MKLIRAEMSLRRQLLLTLSLSFCVLWALAALWLYSDLRIQMRETLDQRLAASARMVAGLVSQLPEDARRRTTQPMLSIPPSTGVACQVSSLSGQIIMRTHGEFAGQLDATAPGFSNKIIDGESWRIFTHIEDDLQITTADRLTERVMLQRNVILVAVLPFIVALLGSLIMLWLGIRRGLRPLEHLRSELACRAPETLTPVKISNAPTELLPVIDTLNRLLVRTSDTLKREQRFTNDAAHELRTPLTAIKTHVQLASRLPSEQAHEALAQAEAGIARLQRILDQLLILARVEVEYPDSEIAYVNSKVIVKTALADLTDHERITVIQKDKPVTVNLPHELAAAALRNLLENSLRHTPHPSPITLEVQTKAQNVIFTLSDRGDWPASQSTHSLTQRFWQRNDQTNKRGSGLGLAIVATICERFGGSLEFTARDDGGLVARLTLPISEHSAR